MAVGLIALAAVAVISHGTMRPLRRTGVEGLRNDLRRQTRGSAGERFGFGRLIGLGWGREGVLLDQRRRLRGLRMGAEGPMRDTEDNNDNSLREELEARGFTSFEQVKNLSKVMQRTPQQEEFARQARLKADKLSRERWEDFEFDPENQIAERHLNVLRKFGRRSVFEKNPKYKRHMKYSPGEKAYAVVDGKKLQLEIVQVARSKCSVLWIEESNKSGQRVVSTVKYANLFPANGEDGGERRNIRENSEVFSLPVWYGVPESVLEKLSRRGIRTPTDIQSSSYLPILNGQDTLLVDQCGSGKTLGYLLPVISQLNSMRKLSKDTPMTPRALIVCPTLELAQQVTQVAGLLFEAGSSCYATSIAQNGDDLELKNLEFSDVDILVTWPPQIPHLTREGLLRDVKICVIDEADIYFHEILTRYVFQLEDFLESTLKDAQRVFVSATMPAEIQERIKQTTPGLVPIVGKGLHTAPNIDITVAVSRQGEDSAQELAALIQKFRCRRTLIFTDESKLNKDLTETLSKLLKTHQFYDMTISKLDHERQANLKEFCYPGKKAKVLVSSLLTSIGVDFEGASIDHVIIDRLPEDNLALLRKLGRTGRLGRRGKATLLVSRKERSRAIDLASRLRAGKPLRPSFFDGAAALKDMKTNGTMDALNSIMDVKGKTEDEMFEDVSREFADDSFNTLMELNMKEGGGMEDGSVAKYRMVGKQRIVRLDDDILDAETTELSDTKQVQDSEPVVLKHLQHLKGNNESGYLY